jgi:hypothetical protein
MSGHLRFCIAAFVLLTSLPTSASSNPLAEAFGVSPPQTAAEPAPAEKERECLPRPGTSTADGQRWVYRTEGGRKCWFQAAEGTATVKQARHRIAKHRVAAAEENEATARRKQKAVMDARAELLRSQPAETSQPTRPVPEPKVVDAVSAPVTAAAAFAPLVANRATDQLTPDQPTPRRLDAETLLAAAPVQSDVVASSAPAAAPVAPVAAPIAEAADDGWGSMATWLGVLLMALGLAAVLGASQPLREAVLLRRH